MTCESEANEAKRDMIKYMKTDEAVKDSDPLIQFSCQGGCTARGTIEGAEGRYCQTLTCADDCLIDIPEDLIVTDGHMAIAPDAAITQENDRETPIRATSPSKARSSKAPTQDSVRNLRAEVMGFNLAEQELIREGAVRPRGTTLTIQTAPSAKSSNSNTSDL